MSNSDLDRFLWTITLQDTLETQDGYARPNMWTW